MISAIGIICFILGGILHWIALARAMRCEGRVRESSKNYAEQLYRSNFFLTLLMQGSVRITTLIFVSPPKDLKVEMLPIRRMEVISVALVFIGFILLAIIGRD